MMQPISIIAISSISALGSQKDEIWENYLHNKHAICRLNNNEFVARLTDADSKRVQRLKESNRKYKNLDISVLYALYVSKKAYRQSGWTKEHDFGINIGSSRGATTLFEKYYKSFLQKNKLSSLTSPTTTLGNISSWVSHDLQCLGPNISHSVTCSSGLHAVINAMAWINSNMCDKFLVGGSEAPLTNFTIAQMQALGVYVKKDNTSKYPCRSMDLSKQQNSMVLGEAASVVCLQKGDSDKALAQIVGIGYATEILEHNTSISTDAKCMQKAMKMALKNHHPREVDVIITHTPGTINGDKAEMTAITSVFTENIPALTTNKWKLGHTLASSGMLSIELAILMMEKQTYVPVPFLAQQKTPNQINKILVNAVGFGGNAVSILLSSA